MAELTLSDWPDALHLSVLQHLGSAQEVWSFLVPYGQLCRATQLMVQSPSLWSHVDLSAVSEGVSPVHLQRLLGRPYVQQSVCGLSVRGIHIAEALPEIVAGLANLQSLDVGRCPHVDGRSLGALCAALGPGLRRFTVDATLCFEDEHAQLLCERCSDLQCLDVRFCERLAKVYCFMQSPTRWRSLQLDGCFRLDVSYMLQAEVTFDCLEELSLDGELLEADVLALLPRRCPRLRSLTISFAAELDGPTLASLAHLRQLESLTLKKAPKPVDDEWAGFFLKRSADRPPCSEGWRVLNFCECELLCDGAAQTLAGTAQPRLVELDLSWCWNLGDEGLSAVLDVSPGLRQLRLAGLKNISAKGLVPCCRMPSLEEVDCSSCNSVADSFLEFLLRLFAGRAGGGGDALPCLGTLPRFVATAAQTLWSQRKIWAKRPEIKNYYAQRLEDWAQLRPAQDVASFAEPFLEEDAAKRGVLAEEPQS